MQSFPSEQDIRQAVAEEISTAFETINGPSVNPSNISVDLSDQENPVVTVKLPVNIVRSDNYVGLCYY